jgi:zinc protease
MKLAPLLLACLVGCQPPRIVAPLRYEDTPGPSAGAPSAEDVPPPVEADRNPMQCTAAVSVAMPGGLRLIVIERHAYPTVMARLNIVPTSLADTGPDAMRVEFLGATFLPDDRLYDGASGSWNSGSCAVEAWGAAADSAEVIDRLARAVRRSTVSGPDDARRFQAATLAIGDVARRPAQILNLNAYAASFGRPFFGGPGRLPDAFGLAELARVRDAVVRPDQATLVIAGDITPEAARAEVEASFGWWKSAPALAPAPRAPDPPAASWSPKLAFVEGFGPTQSAIAVTVRGPSRDSPDAPAFAVAAHLLGGGLASLAFRSVREELGVAYQVGADIHWLRGASLLKVSGTVETSTTVDSLRALLRVVRTFRQTGANEGDVARARAVLRAHALRDETSSLALGRSVTTALVAGGPLDGCWFARSCQDVTAADVLRVARTYLDEDALHVVVIAPDESIADDLAPLGLGKPTRRTAYGYDVVPR